MSASDVDQALESYRKAPAIRAKVKKTVEQEMMGTETKSEGEFYFSKGKLRMDIHEPEKTILVYDGQTFWLESRTDDGHVVVTKMPAANLRKSDSILASLFDRKDVLKGFDLRKTNTADKLATYDFEAKDKKKADILTLQIALRGQDIERITYKDQLENKVTLEFSDVKRVIVEGDRFAYKPPKGADVTEP
jgi:outer membrane lipoprotein-sorting protein